MIKRKIKGIILKSLKTYPVVGILGSRQVGKTTLAKAIKEMVRTDAIYLDLELPSDLNKLQDAELYLRQFEKSLVIIDEIQRMPSLYPLLRALVDQNRIGGRFLILGSASPELIRHSSESLAGRIIYHELTPLNLFETDAGKLKNLLLRGGYPNSYLAKNDDESFIWRESYIKTYLERDIPQLEIHIPAMQLRRFWTMLAHSHGQLWNASKIAGSLGISAPTVRRYLDILESTFIVRQLQPYHNNTKKRLIKSPKVYIRDSGLNHALLRIKTLDDLTGHPSVGASWEGFVIEQIVSLLPENSQYYFYRSNAGAE
ncbi:ATPase, partial [Smithella sp. D17]